MEAGIAPLSVRAHGNVFNEAGGIGNIVCNTARDGIAPLSTRAHGDVCNKAGGIDIIGCNPARDMIAPLRVCVHDNVWIIAGSIGVISCNAIGGDGLVVLLFCSSKNDSPNKALPPNVGSPKRSAVLKRKSPSQGNGGA